MGLSEESMTVAILCKCNSFLISQIVTKSRLRGEYTTSNEEKKSATKASYY